MQAASTINGPDLRTRNRRPQTAIWLALAIAILVHFLLFLLPAIKPIDLPVSQSPGIEIQVQYEEKQLVIEVPPEPVVKPDPVIEEPPLPIETAAIEVTEQLPVELTPVAEPPKVQPIPSNDLTDTLNGTRAKQLSRAILSSQFISEPSVTDKIFGPAIPEAPVEAKEFHFPFKPNMISMLDKPIPDLPFEYTQDLVYFAYEPGVKGDLQRFWDKITPEFGWRTKYGTEVKCVWVLVVAACGWGRSK